MIINNHIRLDTKRDCILIKKSFAEKYLSTSAKKRSKLIKDDYVFDNKMSFIVFYELPMFFNFDFMFIMRGLINYCVDYLEENNINDSNIYINYMSNRNKDIK